LLGLDGVKAYARRKKLWKEAIEKARSDGMSEKEIGKLKIRVPVVTTGGLSQVETTIAEEKKNLGLMNEYAETCQICPLNVVKQTTEKPCIFGCYSSITFPISELAEQMLAATVEYVATKRKGQPEFLLVKEILDMRLIPHKIGSMRASGRHFLEAEDPEFVEFEHMGRKAVVDTNQILEIVFGYNMDNARASHLYQPFLHTLDASCESVGADWKERIKHDKTIDEIRTFVNSVKIASNNGCGIYITL
jgi:hypothetical protein